MTSHGGAAHEVYSVSIDDLFAVSTPDVPKVDLGMYDAELAAVTTTYLSGGQFGEGLVINDEFGNKANRFRWEFLLLDETGEPVYETDEDGNVIPGDPITVDCVTGLQFYPLAKNPSKQSRIMLALLTPDEAAVWKDGGKCVPLTALLGRKVQVQVDENSKGWPTAANVLPPRARRAKARSTAAESDA